LRSFSEELQRHGKQLGGMLLKKELVRGIQIVREHLCLTDDEEIIRLERLRTADGEPVAYEVACLPYPRAGKIHERANELADGSLYRLMRI
jgi:GntR family transcriptional regulator